MSRHTVFCKWAVAAACIVGLLAVPSSSVAQIPIVHYAFDGGDAIDTGSGEPANGDLQATADFTDNTPGGLAGMSLDLSAEGLDSWVNGGDAAKVDTLEQFTMTTWINLQGLNADHGGSGNVRLLAKQSDGAFDGFSWNLNPPNFDDRTPGNFKMGMFIGGEDGFGFGQSTEDVGADDQWTFVAVSYDGTNDEDNMYFYVGDESSDVTQLGAPLSVFAGGVKSTAGRATLNIGYTDGAPGNDFSINGYQDDVRIYDQILSEEQLDAVRLENLTMSLAGDFNNDGVLDAADIDLLSAEVRGGGANLSFDVSGDHAVSDVDRDVWVTDLKATYFGDSDLDGEFSSTDFVVVFSANEYEDAVAGNSSWATGDWNGDGDFDSSDFVKAFQGQGYEQGPRAPAAVPEPSPASLLLAAGLLLIFKFRKGL